MDIRGHMDICISSTDLLHRAFEAQVNRTPSQVAVVTGERRSTYTEVNQRANQLARTLRAQGVGNRAYVGVCVDRDEWLVPALLAVLKVGCAYVPLDPAYPSQRLAWIVADAALNHVITTSRQRGAPWL